VLYGADGKERGKLVATQDGWTRLVFVGDNDKARISIGMGPDGTASTTVYDKTESIRIAAGIDPDDKPVFTVLDERGVEVLGLPSSPMPEAQPEQKPDAEKP
jgi:hypothetical protein